MKNLIETDALLQQRSATLSQDSNRAILGKVMCEIDRAILHGDSSPRAIKHMDEAKKLLNGVIISLGGLGSL